MNTPREFKIKVYAVPDGINIVWDGNLPTPEQEHYHLIEYSAYEEILKLKEFHLPNVEALVKERDELRDKGENLCCELGNVMLERERLRSRIIEVNKFLHDANKENNKLRADLAIAVEALEFAESFQRHSCNIEYGNDTGIENCVRCKLLNAITKIKGEK